MPNDQLANFPIGPAVAALLIVVVLAWRLRRLSQTKQLRLEFLWVTPAVFLALGALTIFSQPLDELGWVYVAASLVLGAAFGWWRGKLMQISVDPQTHDLSVKASPAGLILIVAIIAVRFALRGVILGQASSWHLSIATITDVFMAFIVALMVIQRVEMFLRGSRLLAEVRAA